MRHGHYLGILVLALLFATGANAGDSGVTVEIAPYAWLAGVDGTVTAGGRSVSFDKSFTDLVNDVDLAFMGLAAVRYNRFVLFGQFDYFQLDTNGQVKADNGPVPIQLGVKVDTTIDTAIKTVAAGYQFDIFGDHKLDVLLGGRQLDLKTKIDADGTVGAMKVSEKDDVTDAIIMVSPVFHFGQRWEFRTLISYGIAGDSNDTYELQPQLHYRITPSVTAAVGYRKLHYKIDSGQKGTSTYSEFDGDMEGLMLGVGWTFGGKEK